MKGPVEKSNNYPKPIFGSYVEEDVTARYPPRARSPGPTPGQDFDTLTTTHGKPRGRFEVNHRKEVSR